MHLKKSSGKWRLFYLCLNVLMLLADNRRSTGRYFTQCTFKVCYILSRVWNIMIIYFVVKKVNNVKQIRTLPGFWHDTLEVNRKFPSPIKIQVSHSMSSVVTCTHVKTFNIGNWLWYNGRPLYPQSQWPWTSFIPFRIRAPIVFLGDVVSNPCPNFKDDLTKALLKLWHGWLITFHNFVIVLVNVE